MCRSLAVIAAVAVSLAAAPAAGSYEFDELVYLSCEEAWAKSGESIDQVVEMIRVLTEFSLQKRELAVPEGREELSAEFGELIKAFCTVQPDDLLYNAVDKALRRLL
jgi:YmgD protein